MSNSYKKRALWSELKFFLKDCFSQAKARIFFMLFVLCVSLITGIIIAIKCHSGAASPILHDYGLVSFVGEGVTSSIFARICSIVLVAIILFICSFSNWLFPFAVVLVAYRTYLLGFNLCLLFLFYGVSGIILTLLVILPCQILMILLVTAYYVMLTKCGCAGGGIRDKLKMTLITMLGLIVICLIEALLLLLFSANVIIVI